MKKIALFIAILFSLVIVFHYISKSRTFQFFGEIYPKINTRQKVIALTFDDGPTEKTDTILSILNTLGIKATFFLNGNDILNHKEQTKKIVLEGHELGNHSYSHQRMILKTYGFIKDEIEKTDSLIREAGYLGAIHFRPPYGKKLVLLPYYLQQNNRKTIMWDIEPESFHEISISSDKISEYVLDNSAPGSIILLHIMRDKKNISLKSVSRIVKDLKSKGYEFKTISEILKTKDGF